jgi:hypothetical protein
MPPSATKVVALEIPPRTAYLRVSWGTARGKRAERSQGLLEL